MAQAIPHTPWELSRLPSLPPFPACSQMTLNQKVLLADLPLPEGVVLRVEVSGECGWDGVHVGVGVCLICV